MKNVYRITYVYQAIIWIISAINYTIGIINFILPGGDRFSLMVHLIILCISLAVVGSNIYLLIMKDTGNILILKSLHFNKWINVIQILNIQIIGLTYYTIIGARILMYYEFDETQRFSINLGFYKLQTELSYTKSDIIFVGINLIAILLYIIFDRNIRDHNEQIISKLL